MNEIFPFITERLIRNIKIFGQQQYHQRSAADTLSLLSNFINDKRIYR